jgi:arabinofuranosyltransferase
VKPALAMVMPKVTYICISIIAAFVLMEVARNRKIQVAIVGVVFVLIGVIASLSLVDDSYISLRFARNYADGHGFVFNIGERVEGYTCFLWVWLLGTIKRLIANADLVILAKTLGIGFSILGILLIYRFSTYLVTRSPRGEASADALSPFPLMLIAANFPFVFWGFSGMETGLYVSCLVGSSYLFCRYLLEPERGVSNLFWSSLILVFAMMTRPEAYALPACNLGFILAARRRDRAKHVVLFLLPLLAVFVPYFVWRYRYYGYPLPNTYYAKVGGGSLSLSWFGLRYLAAGAVPHIAFIGFIAAKVIRRRRGMNIADYYLLALMLIWAATVIYTGADHFHGYRFFVYVLPFMYVFSLDEINFRIGRAADRLSGLFHIRSRPIIGHSMIALIAFLTFLGLFFFRSEGSGLMLRRGRTQAERWAPLGKWFEENTRPEDVVATPVVGAIGYYCHNTILDMLGIVDRVIAHTPVEDPGLGPKDHNRFNTEYLLGRRPKYIYLFETRSTEEEYLERPSRLPALGDLKRHFPRDDYEFVVIAIGKFKYCLYVRRD